MAGELVAARGVRVSGTLSGTTWKKRESESDRRERREDAVVNGCAGAVTAMMTEAEVWQIFRLDHS